jgi:SAM-dependent methyltransferase
MHESVHSFVQSIVEAFELQGPVYEFGCSPSHSPAKAPSSTNCFIDIGYVGCDLHQGAETDQLEELSALPYPSESARTICCINVLERVFEPQRAMNEMIRLLTPGGLVLLCASSPSEPSGPSGHYWQMTPQGVERLLSPLEATLVGWQGPDEAPHTVFGIGCKSPIPNWFLPGARRFLDAFQRRLEAAAQQARRSERLRRWLLGWTRNHTERQRDAQHHKARFAFHFPLGSKLDLHHILMESSQPDAQSGSRIDFRE